MLKKVTFALGALALALGGAALVAPAAHADSVVSVSGAMAAFRSDGEGFRLTDTACDRFRVYLSYRLGGRPEVRHYFGGGCYNSIEYDKRFEEDVRVTYRACVDLPGEDRCSVWRVDTT